MKTRVLIALLLFIMAINIASPAAVYAVKDNPNSNKNKDKVEKTKDNSKDQTVPKNYEAKIFPVDDSINYDFEVTQFNFPSVLNTNEIAKTDIELKNTSNFDWDKQQVKISYHWVDANGEYEIYSGENTKLIKDVKVDQLSDSVQSLSVKAPSLPGDYKLRIDLIKGVYWYTNYTDYKYEVNVRVNGSLEIASYESEMLLNDGDEFANSEILKATVTPYNRQPGSENAAFIYDYVQFTDSSEEDIQNGTAQWSKWQLLPDPWNTSDVNFNIKDTSVGVKRIFMRYRAIKKLYDTSPDSYGSAIYRYGRAEKTTDVYFVDEIFFDNVPPVGDLTINNGAASTSSRTGSLQISASDTVDGVEGSGLNGMRSTNDCDLENIDSNNWSDWEDDIVDKEDYELGTGDLMVVCVQIRDKAGNITTLSDDIVYYVPSSTGGGYLGWGSYATYEPGNVTYIDSNGNRQVSKLAGVPGNPYGDKTAKSFSKPRIYVDSVLFGDTRITTVQSTKVDPPEITYIDVNDDQSQFTVYGVAIPKYYEVEVVIRYQVEKDNCSWDCIETKLETKTTTLEHVGLALYEDTPWWWFSGDPEVNWLWNDAEDGRWQFTMNLDDSNQHDLNLGDTLYARTWAWGGFDTGIPEIGYLDYGAQDRVYSGKSNLEEIADTHVGLEMKLAYENWGLVFESDDRLDFTLYDLLNINNAFNKIPSKFYKNSTGEFKVYKKTSSTDPNNICDIIYTDDGESFTFGYVLPSSTDTFYLCSAASENESYSSQLQTTVIHEVTHIFQKLVSNNDIEYGSYVVNSPYNLLHIYYDKLFDAENGKWVIDDELVRPESVSEDCFDYNYAEPEKEFFLSWYHCVTSYRPEEIDKYQVMPEESMAIEVATYLMDYEKLENQDKYSYTYTENGETKTNSGDINRREYIKNVFLNN